jgi:hypothetical protein
MNLDADLELATGKGYSPSKAVLAAMAPQQAKLAESLVGPDDVWLDSGLFGPHTGVSFDRQLAAWGASTDLSTGDAGLAGPRGRAFCPTPRAVALMRAAGVEPEPHPTLEVLRRVNGREFCAELGQTLPGAQFVTSTEDAIALLVSAPPMGRQWRAKRAFGMAGRGQRPIAAGALSEADAKFLAASISRDRGIQLEPEVEIVREVAMHAMLAGGDVRFGPVIEQRCDDSGQWLSSLATSEELPALLTEARRVAESLHAAGYFGPFGVDAYFYRDGADIRLQPRSEINARYSMGFAASGLLR